MIALDRLEGAAAIVIDRAGMSVSVGAAVTYAALADALNSEGLALSNLASLPHISVAGAVTTATHGSGDREGNLATSVLGLQLVTGIGEVIDAAQGDDRFEGIVVSLGKLGIVTRVTLSVQPYYELRQHVYEEMEWEQLFAHFDEITAECGLTGASCSPLRLPQSLRATSAWRTSRSCVRTWIRSACSPTTGSASTCSPSARPDSVSR